MAYRRDPVLEHEELCRKLKAAADARYLLRFKQNPDQNELVRLGREIDGLMRRIRQIESAFPFEK